MKIWQPVLFVLLTSPFLMTANAGEEIDLTKGLSYPELEVTPRASDRLLMEAKEERSHRFSNHGSMLISSMATLLTAFNSQGNPDDKNKKSSVDANDWATQAGYAIGGGWLVANIALMTAYEPYREGYKKIKDMPKEGKREELARERIAEEALYAPARLGTKLLWVSAFTNFSASVYMASSGTDSVKLYGAVSAMLALAPIFFPYQWIDVGNQHKLYKKKIYGPIAGLTLLKTGEPNQLQPGIGLTFNY